MHLYPIERWQRALDAARAGAVELRVRDGVSVIAADQLAALAESLPAGAPLLAVKVEIEGKPPETITAAPKAPRRR